ncbi:MAG: 23S rRNA (guanosine(2251)-2'-O)-methyltransferase RlmB [bacterium]|nr:23S rRNA (guanosine(2251)-2'-O)-methyltransferase RlmB [bacterium]
MSNGRPLSPPMKPNRPFSDRRRRPRDSEESAPLPLSIYGRNPVLEALRRGLVETLSVAKSAHGENIREIRALAAAQHIPVRDDDRSSDDSEAVAQGVRARIRLPEPSADFEVLEEIVANRPAPLVLLLDGIEDPRNFGAILRTAYASGVDAVIFRKRRQSPLTDVVFKTSAGCAALIDLYQVTNLDQTVRELKANGWWIVSAAADPHARSYHDCDWDRPTVLVLGAEGAGVSPVLIKRSDLTVKVPMYRDLDSLNVSAAAAVLLFEAAKCRQLVPEV